MSRALKVERVDMTGLKCVDIIRTHSMIFSED